MSDNPIFDEVAFGRDDLIPPPLDDQSRAYREMGPADAVPDEHINDYLVRSHRPLWSGVWAGKDTPEGLIRLPADHERDSWDAGREDPR